MMPELPLNPSPNLMTVQGRQMDQRLTAAGYRYQGTSNQGHYVYNHPSGSQVTFGEIGDYSYGPRGLGWVPGTLQLPGGVAGSQKINGPDDPVLRAHLAELSA